MVTIILKHALKLCYRGNPFAAEVEFSRHLEEQPLVTSSVCMSEDILDEQLMLG